jgi:hypothetical protein
VADFTNPGSCRVLLKRALACLRRLNTRGTLKNVTDGAFYFGALSAGDIPARKLNDHSGCSAGSESRETPKIALQQAYLSCCDWQLPALSPSTAAKVPKAEVEATTVMARRTWGQGPFEYANSNDKAKSTACVPPSPRGRIAYWRQSTTHWPQARN